MTTKLLRVLGKSLFLAGLLCSVCVFADNGTVQAQPPPAPGFTQPGVAMVSTMQMPPAPDKWEIKGTTTVENLPADAETVYFTYVFYRKAVGGSVTAFDNGTLNATVGKGGTVSLDTGYRTVPPTVAKGEEFTVTMVGSYFVKNNPMPQALGTQSSKAIVAIK